MVYPITASRNTYTVVEVCCMIVLTNPCSKLSQIFRGNLKFNRKGPLYIVCKGQTQKVVCPFYLAFECSWIWSALFPR